MKRDMDLVRRLLLEIEAVEARIHAKQLIEREVADVGRPTIDHHIAILSDAGLIQAYHEDDRHRGTAGWNVLRPTWEGHEFLDTIRDPEIWRKTKAGASQVGGVAFGLLKSLATAYAKQFAKERLGLDLG